MTSSNGSQATKVYLKSNIPKTPKFKFNLSENLGSVKFYLLKNNEYYIKVNKFYNFNEI